MWKRISPALIYHSLYLQTFNNFYLLDTKLPPTPLAHNAATPTEPVTMGYIPAIIRASRVPPNFITRNVEEDIFTPTATANQTAETSTPRDRSRAGA